MIRANVAWRFNAEICTWFDRPGSTRIQMSGSVTPLFNRRCIAQRFQVLLVGENLVIFDAAVRYVTVSFGGTLAVSSLGSLNQIVHLAEVVRGPFPIIWVARDGMGIRLVKITQEHRVCDGQVELSK